MRSRLSMICACLLLCTFCVNADTDTASQTDGIDTTLQIFQWYIWVILLFGTTVLIGIVSVLGGVGGGVLYVPILGSFFPFHMDFVRCAGLIVVLCGSLSAGANLIRQGLVSFRLAMPAALIASIFSIVGAFIGLSLPQNVVHIALGAAIVAIAGLITVSKKSEYPIVQKKDTLVSMLHISGVYHEQTSGTDVEWRVHRTIPGFLLFVVVGLIAGMFGLGAGWATVPVLNLVMGAPLKICTATSVFLMSITAPSAAWVYITQGALLPVIVIPSVIGMMLGTWIGSKIMPMVKPRAIRYIVIVLLLAAGLQSIVKGVRG